MRYVCTLTKGEEKIATGTVTVVCVSRGEDGRMKARPLPSHIAARFEVSAGADARTERGQGILPSGTAEPHLRRSQAEPR